MDKLAQQSSLVTPELRPEKDADAHPGRGSTVGRAFTNVSWLFSSLVRLELPKMRRGTSLWASFMSGFLGFFLCTVLGSVVLGLLIYNVLAVVTADPK